MALLFSTNVSHFNHGGCTFLLLWIMPSRFPHNPGAQYLHQQVFQDAMQWSPCTLYPKVKHFRLFEFPCQYFLQFCLLPSCQDISCQFSLLLVGPEQPLPPSNFWWLGVKNPPASTGNVGSILGSGRSPGGGNVNPLQYSCLGIPMDRGAWPASGKMATVHGIAKELDTT